MSSACVASVRDPSACCLITTLEHPSVRFWQALPFAKAAGSDGFVPRLCKNADPSNDRRHPREVLAHPGALSRQRALTQVAMTASIFRIPRILSTRVKL